MKERKWRKGEKERKDFPLRLGFAAVSALSVVSNGALDSAMSVTSFSESTVGNGIGRKNGIYRHKSSVSKVSGGHRDRRREQKTAQNRVLHNHRWQNQLTMAVSYCC